MLSIRSIHHVISFPSFQGREKDVAIFSCVRASKEKSIGFVADFRRMNVGITRARSSVLVCLFDEVCMAVSQPWLCGPISELVFRTALQCVI